MPVVLAGFELTSQVVVTAADLDAIRRVGSTTADYFHRNSLAWCRYWTETFPADAGFHPWDSAAVCWLRHPEYFVTEQRGWRIRRAPGSRSRERPHEVYWLETDSVYPGPRLTYCTGFTRDSARAFVRDIVTTVY